MVIFGWLVIILLAGLLLSVALFLITAVCDVCMLWPLVVGIACLVLLMITMFVANAVTSGNICIIFPAWASFMCD